ncbi:MAG TPA: GNAT family N-acetyltransferase [bacterium]|nr:GNAT family N-acetyltransferase [bacterium]
MRAPAEIAIAALPNRRVGEAVDVLVRAFWQDPIITFFLHRPPRRAMGLRAFFGNVVRAHLGFGHVYGAFAEHRVVGTAVWRPPDAAVDALLDRIRDVATRVFMRGLFPRTAGELFRGLAATTALHPDVPHWYLFFMGVDVDVQGQGIGSKLLAPVLGLADETQMLCYLETPFPRTHAFYQRHGFTITSATHPFRGAPTLWTMTRRPEPPLR